MSLTSNFAGWRLLRVCQISIVLMTYSNVDCTLYILVAVLVAVQLVYCTVRRLF